MLNFLKLFKFIKFIQILRNGEPIIIPWQIQSFKLNTCWPLASDTRFCSRIFYNFISLLIIIIYLLTIYAELEFLKMNLNNLFLSTESLVTIFVGIALLLRLILQILRRKMFKRFLMKFYKIIYVTK